MGLFLHIPFPHIEVLRVLPVYGELLQAMLAYDVLGFQTEPDRDAFRSAVASVWGAQALTSDHTVTLGGRRVVTGVFPIGVDVDAIQREAIESQDTDACKRMIAGLLGRRLMIGVDRLDYSKGLVERFKAYERFLETHPENQNRVTFLQIAPLSRSDVRAYAEIRRDLEQTTGRTNGRFADTDWTPDPISQPQFSARRAHGFHAFGAHRHRHAGARWHEPGGEGIRGRAGSGRSGRADPLDAWPARRASSPRAVMVNPYDSRGMAHAIQQAFNMPLAERRERHQAMLDVLRKNSITAWHTSFVDTLESVAGRVPQLALKAG